MKDKLIALKKKFPVETSKSKQSEPGGADRILKPWLEDDTVAENKAFGILIKKYSNIFTDTPAFIQDHQLALGTLRSQ